VLDKIILEKVQSAISEVLLSCRFYSNEEVKMAVRKWVRLQEVSTATEYLNTFGQMQHCAKRLC
jgi:hypothetical protein